MRPAALGPRASSGGTQLPEEQKGPPKALRAHSPHPALPGPNGPLAIGAQLQTEPPATLAAFHTDSSHL